MSYIEFKNIKKSFGAKEVLKDVSLDVEEGEFVTFLGSSGCGKTTLLRCLAGLETIDTGSIFLDGKDITLSQAKDRGISMVFQQYSLFPTMNLYDNVSFGLRMTGLDKEAIDQQVNELLSMVELRDHLDKYPNQMSGGEQQRAALARALVMKPKVLLLDEPFSAIDAKLRKELQVHVKDLHKRLGMTTIFVTHDQEEALTMSDKIFMFHDGVIEQSGSPEEIYIHPETKYAAGFIGSYNLVCPKDLKISSCDEGLMLAFRPEIVEISRGKYSEKRNYLYVSGRITKFYLQGNVTRMVVQTQENVEITVDKVSGLETDYAIGCEVYLRISNDNIMRLSR